MLTRLNPVCVEISNLPWTFIDLQDDLWLLWDSQQTFKYLMLIHRCHGMTHSASDSDLKQDITRRDGWGGGRLRKKHLTLQQGTEDQLPFALMSYSFTTVTLVLMDRTPTSHGDATGCLVHRGKKLTKRIWCVGMTDHTCEAATCIKGITWRLHEQDRVLKARHAKCKNKRL